MNTFTKCTLVGAGLLATLLSSTVARADGGSTIASAPTVSFGTQEFGNTQTGGIGPLCEASGDKAEFWILPTTAGDHVVIDWESSDDADMQLGIYKPGTTDFNVAQHHAHSFGLNSNNKAQSKFAAKKPGSYIMEFNSCDFGDGGGPYDFTAYVQHALVVGLPQIKSMHRTGNLKVQVHTPSGGVIASGPTVALQVRRASGANSHWATVGGAKVRNSIAHVPYRLSHAFRHQHLKVRAVAGGGGFRLNASQTEKVNAG